MDGIKEKSGNSKPTHGDKSEAIDFKNGEKWKVHDTMMLYMRVIERDINIFEETGSSDFAYLGRKLQANIELLTSNCTMEGKAHDERHKRLLPFIDLVYEFSKEKDEKRSLELFSEIKGSMKTFNLYFQ